MIILNVDDDPEDRELFLEAIQRIDRGIQCIFVGDALEAHRILKDRMPLKFDYIFLDINMPKMNGFELLELLSNDHLVEKTPVYMYSTSVNPREVARVDELGAKFIRKQNDFRSMIKALSAILVQAK